MPDIVTEAGKWCVTCEQFLPLDAFAKDTRNRSGRSTRCRSCKNSVYKTGKTHTPAVGEHARWLAHTIRSLTDAEVRYILSMGLVELRRRNLGTARADEAQNAA